MAAGSLSGRKEKSGTKTRRLCLSDVLREKEKRYSVDGPAREGNFDVIDFIPLKS